VDLCTSANALLLHFKKIEKVLLIQNLWKPCLVVGALFPAVPQSVLLCVESAGKQFFFAYRADFSRLWRTTYQYPTSSSVKWVDFGIGTQKMDICLISLAKKSGK
jgi:hypothetical protein